MSGFDLILLILLIVGVPVLSWLDRKRARPADIFGDDAYLTRCRRLLIDILLLWGVVVAIFAFGSFDEPPFSGLGLSLPVDWSMWVIAGWLVAAVLAVMQLLGSLRMGDAEKQAALDMLENEPGIASITPVSGRDWPWWMVMSLTAGVTEEIIYRGYLIHLFAGFMEIWQAAALSWLLFIIAHAYQNARGLSAVAAMCALLTVLAVVCDSIWPSILLHSVVDICSGYMILQARANPPAQSSSGPDINTQAQC